jgi:hypothetical protein
MLLLMAAVGSCTSKRALDFGGHRYLIPTTDIEAIVRDNGHTYARLEPAGRRYWLILDTRADRRQRERHEIVISSVSDTHPVVDYLQSPAGLIACRNVPHFACGLEMRDEGVRWSLVFDRADLSKASAYKDNAAAILASYRSGSPA